MNQFNYTQPANEALPAGMYDRAQLDPRMDLYNSLALPYESYEDFCDRMADDHGSNWVYKFNRKSH